MFCRFLVAKPIITSSLVRSTIQNLPKSNGVVFRQFQRDSRQSFERTRLRTRNPTLKERLMAPAGPNAFGIGRGALAGGAALGLGALAFYGLGMSSGTSAWNNSLVWPQYVRDRIRSTYLYFGGSIGISALAAAGVFRTPAIMNIVGRGGWVALIVSMAVMMGSGMVARSIPYQPGFGTKQLAWAVHCAIIGAVIAPICFVGGPILTRAALYSAGVIGGLSTVAVCAPSDKFLYMGGPLAIGLGVVFASSVAGMFLAPTTALGAGLASMSLYGGLLLFSGFLLYDTQRIIRRAETHPHPSYAVQPYDPVNGAISIYMDAVNIFIRMVMILSGNGNRRK